MTVQAHSFPQESGPFDQAPQFFNTASVKRRVAFAVVSKPQSLRFRSARARSVPALQDVLNIFAEPDARDLLGPPRFGPHPLESWQTQPATPRAPQRSRLAQSRVVALRRKSVRPQAARPAPALPGGQSIEDLRAMRDHIFHEDAPQDIRPSLPLRIAAQSINLSLIVTALPIGAAALTYNVLRGEDMTFTARLTTLTGLALAIFGGDPSSFFGHLI
ncbi:MAG: hypothetical protein Q7T28_00150 [Cypionkella sp.]|uniref:hypothetical protein n=1 Tax=Cypionkella sp. TaxID=2811411 RepID=UPI002722E8CD|nr:hypothetical protein [Cypionkella sp.]MDO8325330.1 hypothetical protein [Cypionkella sp.]